MLLLYWGSDGNSRTNGSVDKCHKMGKIQVSKFPFTYLHLVISYHGLAPRLSTGNFWHKSPPGNEAMNIGETYII